MKTNLLLNISIGMLCWLLTNQYAWAQLSDITYSIRFNNITSYEGGVGGACWETGNEEYTMAYMNFYDDANGAGQTASGCATCDNNSGSCTYGGSATGTRSNNAYNVTIYTDAYEDDGGARCSFDSGDDCRYTGNTVVSTRTLAYPSNGTYNTATFGNGSHTISYSYTWKYSGSTNPITPTCATQTAAYSAGAIRSWSVYLTAGTTYNFNNCSSASNDTYIRLYASDGYTIVSSGDDNCGVLSSINYTAATTGWHYVELSQFSRSNLASAGTLTYSVIPKTGATFSSPIIAGTIGCTAYSNIQSNVINTGFCNDYGQGSDDIYYQFTLSSAAIVNISHCGSGFDTYMHLLNSAGTLVSSNDDNGPLCTGTAASLQVSLAAGTYYVVSEGFSTNSGNINTQIVIAPPTLGTVSNAGPINFCDAGGNFTTPVTVSGQLGTVVWDWGSNNGVWNNNWITSNSSGTCCFPKKTSNSDGNADRIRYRVVNGPCSVTSGTILIVNRYNEAPTSLAVSSPSYCANAVPGSITLTATFPAAINKNGLVAFYSGSCGGTLLGTVTAGDNITTAALTTTAPSTTTTYYVRYEPGTGTSCANTACATTTVTVNTLSVAPSSITLGASPICSGASTTLTQVGGTLGTGASYKWYTGSCGGTLVGTGASITVTPTATTIYYVRAEGTCNTTTCASNTLTVYGTTITSGAVGGAASLTQCTGGNPALFAVAAPSGGNGIYTYQWLQSNGCTGTWVNATAEDGITNTLNFNPPILTLPTTSTMCYQLRITDGCGNIGYSTVKTYTVVADPVSQTINPTPTAGTTLCAGATVSATFTGGSGGTGTVTDTYEYSTNTGSTWTAYSAGTAIATAGLSGTNVVQVRTRRTATGTGCDNGLYNTVMWSIVADPISPTLNTKTPNVASVCEGQAVSATFNAGTNGVGCSDIYEYRKNGGAWLAYTPGTNISTTVGDVSVEIQARRGNCTAGLDCTEPAFATLATWTVTPDPSITAASATSVCAGGTATLTASPSNGIGCTIQWQDSPDNSTFTNIGGATSASYTTVALTATRYYRAQYICTGSDCGTATSNVITVTVVPEATITISSPADVCNGGSVSFTVTGTSGGLGTCTYQWQDSPDGATWTNISGETTNSYTSATLSATRYYRCLYICSGAGCDPAISNIEQIDVIADPTISVSGATTICSGNTATLTAAATGGAGTCTYQWQESPNGTSGWANVGGNSASYTTSALTANSYYRCLYSCTGGGCDGATSNVAMITVNTLSTEPTGISGSLSLCNGGSTTLSAVGGTLGTGASYKWYSGSCGGTLVGTGSTVTVTPTATTVYYIRIEGTCNTTICASATVTVNPNPSAAVIAGTATICAGTSTNLTVNITGGTAPYTVVYTDGTTNFTVSSYTSGSAISVTPSANTTYTLVSVTDNNGCVVSGAGLSGSAVITVTPLNVAPTTITPSTATVCAGQTVTLSASGGSLATGGTVVWYRSACAGSLANGTVAASTGNPLTITVPASAGIYKYYARYTGPCNNACSSTVFATVTVTAPPTSAVLSGGGNICLGESSTIAVAVTGGTSPYTTNINNYGTATSYVSTTPLSVSPTSTTTYTLTSVSDANGCTASSVSGTATVNVRPSPVASITSSDADNTICAGESVTFTGTSGTHYQFKLNGTNVGTYSTTNTYTTTALVNNDQVNVQVCNDVIFDGTISEAHWTTPLATSAGGAAPGFGAGHETNALYVAADMDDIYLALAGNVQNNNRILIFIDSKAGGYNSGNFGRTSAPQGVDDFNSGTTFDSGFLPDYCLTIGTNAAHDNFYYDLFTLSGTAGSGGGPSTFLGDDSAANIGSSPANGSNTQGFEIAIPKSALGYSSGAVQFMVMYSSDAGFLSNQFLTRANSGEGNYGSGAITFGAASPNLITVAETALTPPCCTTSTIITTTVNSLSVAPTAISGTNSLCPNATTTLTQVGGTLGTGASYKWYSGSCGGTLVGTGASITVTPTATTVYYVRAEGTCNTTTCASITVTVGDLVAPTINGCPSNISLNATMGSCNATATWTAPTANDNCLLASFIGSHSSGSSFAVGTTTVTYTATDGVGNTATCTFTVTVTDNQVPTITCPTNVSVNTDLNSCVATAVALGTPTTADNCSVASVTNDAPTSYPVGNTTVTWIVTDANGLTASCAQTVTVTDNQNPTITCPSNVAVNTDLNSCVATAVALGTPTTADNCSVASVTNDAPTSYPVGTTSVTWIVTDANGLTASCAQTVTVTDNQVPTITCPTDVAVNTDLNACVATAVALGTPTTADNCSVASVTNDAPTSYPVGTISVTWIVADANGLTASCAQTVTVTDNQVPTITCPSNVAVNTDLNSCVATAVALGTPTTADNCSVASVTNDAPTNYPVGTTSVTWIVTDANGLTASCAQTVTVTDNQNPTINCPSNVAVTTDLGSCVATAVALGTPTTADNCSVASVTNNAPTSYPVGNTTVTWIVTDANGLTASCAQMVTVTDNQVPTITCPINVAVTTDLNSCVATAVALGTPTTADNCSVASVTNDALTSYPVGATTVTWIVTDANGLTASCAQTVTVTDNQAPTITCPTNVAVNTDLNSCVATAVALGTPTTADNCSVASVTNDAPASYPVGNTTVTWIVTDANGLTASCAQTVTVTDNQVPTITCPTNVAVNTDLNSCVATAVALGTPTTADNCSVASVTNNAPTSYPVGNTTVTWIVTDANGLTASCAQTVTVTDNQVPTITCPINVAVTTDLNSCVATAVALDTPTTADNCSVASVTNNAPTSYPVGNTTVTWIVTDANGLTASCAQTVTVTDNQVPTITCPTDVAVTTDLGSCVATEVALGTPATADNCSVASVTNDAPTSYPVGNTTVTWIVTDANGLTANCAQTVTVTDNQVPTITCPTDVAVNTDLASCVATAVALGTPTTADNCSVASVTNDAPTSYPVGTTSVTWIVTDANGLTASCAQTVTVTDNQVPTITCPTDVAVNTDAGSCVATAVALGTPTTADNCSVASVTNDAPTSYPVGTTSVTWIVTDANGLTASCAQTVTVTDNQVPTITCPTDVAVTTDLGSCVATEVALGTPTTADNCSVASVTNDAPTSYPVGNTTVTWIVTDANGLTASCAQTVTVTDNQAPTITCPTNVAVNTDLNSCVATAVALGTPTTADNCSVASVTNDAPTSYPVGNTTVTWIVTDANGLTASCAQTVTVTDNQAPTITCPTNVAVTTDLGSCVATAVALGTPTTADNCSVASVTNDAPTSYPVGTTTVTWIVTDANGLTASCAQTVTVTDNQVPTITCPINVAVNTDLNSCVATAVALGTPTTADNCSVASVTNDAPTSYPVGNTTVTWIVTDANGLTASCAQTVTVTDNQVPTINCPSNVAVNTDLNSCVATAVALGTPTTADNCSVANVTNDAPTSYPVGNTTVTWIVTDANGLTASCAQTVTVTDNQAPTITCPTNVVVTTDLNACVATAVALGTPTTADNCSVASVTNDAPTSYPVGNTTVTWIVTDANGLTASCAQTVTVTDNQVPTITCPINVAVTTDLGSCVATSVALGTPTTADNCSVASVTNNAPTSYPVGNTTVTWIVTDANGLTASCAQTVTVTDNQVPTITCPSNVSVTTDLNSCVATAVALGTPTTADNCSVASVTNNAPTSYPVGTTSVTWIVTDANGLTASCAQTVTVTDNQVPTITCPINVAVNTDLNSCVATAVALGTPTTADNCSVASVTNNAPTSYPVGNTTVTWVVTDANGLTASCAQTVTVTDNQAPTITCPINVAVNTDLNSCVATAVALGTPTTADNCSVASVTNDAPTSYPVGNTTVTWIVTDANGLTASCAQTVTVTDNQAPTITCPTDVAMNTDLGSCVATAVALGTPTTADNCSIASVTNDAPASYPVGNTTVTWIVTDANGLTASCAQTVTVTDNQVPTITCPTDVAVNTDLGSCVATAVALGTPTTADNCSVASVTNDALTSYPVGTTTVTWIVTDANGLTASCAQTVTVTDNQVPTITCPTDVVTTTDSDGAGDCMAVVSGLGLLSATDNCSVATITYTLTGVTIGSGSNDASGTTFNLGVTTLTYTVTDIHGNSSSCSATITINDNELPMLTCPADILTYPADAGTCNAIIGGLTATFSDNCSATVAYTLSGATSGSGIDASGLAFNVGTTTVTYTVTDVGGNTATCSFDIEIIDTQVPEFICPDTNTSVTTSGCTAVISIVPPVVIDNCTTIIPVGVREDNLPITDPYTVGHTEIVWTATDASGNTATCKQIVIVDDTAAPVFDSCPLADIAVNTTTGLCEVVALVPALPTGSDACGTISVTGVRSDALDLYDPYPMGTTVITWTMSDASGNTTTCDQNVVVSDMEAPVIACPTTNITENNTIGLCSNAFVVLQTPIGTDNCGTFSISSVVRADALAVNDPYPIGTTTVTWTATDGNGNTATCAQDVTIVDAEAPAFDACPVPASVTTLTSGCSATVALSDPTGTDNCGTFSIVSVVRGDGFAMTDPYPTGTTLVTWTATDGNNNYVTCTQEVVIDSPNSSLAFDACPLSDITATATACSATLTVSTPTATACGGVGATVVGTRADGQLLSAAYPVGTTLITWIATDGFGNTASCAQNVVVTETTAPVFSACPLADVVINANGTDCALIYAVSYPAATDDCGTPSVTFTRSDALGLGDAYPVGNTTITWLATDASGNTATCSQIVTVNETMPPTFNVCPIADTNVNTDAGMCAAIVSIVTPIVSDNCGGASVVGVRADALALTDPYPLGNTIINWTATDTEGNIAVCTQNILVSDAQAPAFVVCPMANITATANTICQASLTIAIPTATDNCGATVTGTRSDGQALNVPYPLGTTVITWQAMDAVGNISTCTQNVVVSDNTPPTFTCPANKTATTTTTSCSATVSITTPTASDWCGTAAIIGTRSDALSLSAAYPKGVTTITWTATDASGNTSTCAQTVTVNDAIKPVLVGVPANTTVSCPVPAAPTVTATDNCSPAPTVTMTQTQTAGDCTTGYTITRTWTATDASGNTITKTQTITVTGTAPSLAITSAVVTNAGAGLSNGGVNISVAGGSCGGAYTYLWSNGATTQDITGVPGGIWYSVTVTCGTQSVVGWYWVKNGTGRTKTEIVSQIATFEVAPNPFSEWTVITLQVSEPQNVTLEVFDMAGRRVADLFTGALQADQIKEVPFYAHELPAGNYICRLSTETGEILQEQIVLVK
jgi:hypothetical protein